VLAASLSCESSAQGQLLGVRTRTNQFSKTKRLATLARCFALARDRRLFRLPPSPTVSVRWGALSRFRRSLCQLLFYPDRSSSGWATLSGGGGRQFSRPGDSVKKFSFDRFAAHMDCVCAPPTSRMRPRLRRAPFGVGVADTSRAAGPVKGFSIAPFRAGVPGSRPWRWRSDPRKGHFVEGFTARWSVDRRPRPELFREARRATAAEIGAVRAVPRSQRTRRRPTAEVGAGRAVPRSQRTRRRPTAEVGAGRAVPRSQRTRRRPTTEIGAGRAFPMTQPSDHCPGDDERTSLRTRASHPTGACVGAGAHVTCEGVVSRPARRASA
jgi:hypothetical protein